MGLDSFIWKSKSEEVDGFGFGTPDDAEEVFYFRKFNALHGYFEDKYMEMGGLSVNDFNCINIEITEEDIKNIFNGFAEGTIKPRSGFFFGDTTRVCPYDLMQLGEALGKCTEALEQGYKLFYSSWW